MSCVSGTRPGLRRLFAVGLGLGAGLLHRLPEHLRRLGPGDPEAVGDHEERDAADPVLEGFLLLEMSA